MNNRKENELAEAETSRQPPAGRGFEGGWGAKKHKCLVAARAAETNGTPYAAGFKK